MPWSYTEAQRTDIQEGLFQPMHQPGNHGAEGCQFDSAERDSDPALAHPVRIARLRKQLNKFAFGVSCVTPPVAHPNHLKPLECRSRKTLNSNG